MDLLISVFIFLKFFLIDGYIQEIPLPGETSSLFSGSGNCASCHTGNGIILSENGVDISPVTHWRSSIMGNASKDPFWRAVVEEEVHQLPQYQFLIESTCTKCHAPMGWRQAIQNGDSGYTMVQMKQNALAKDGVSCTACHQIKNTNFGMQSSYSGGYIITTERLIYGPYQNPLAGPMINSVNYTPVYSASANQSELCAICHTLFTPTVNYSGQITGYFPEQTPYIEWKNSIYKTGGIQCQTCHMPVTNTPIDISTSPPFDTTKRTPYWKHLFAGGNSFVGKILRNNVDSLFLSASPQHFDTTLFYINKSLKESSLNLSSNTAYSSGILNVAVTVENNTGHKIPTGIPYRRMWIHLKVSDQSNNVVFESGNWNSSGEIIGLDSTYEQHYTGITNQNQVQIYEGSLKDVNGNFTYKLLRAASYIKDNRLPPKGFTNQHPSYDTVAITGGAASDTNFNRQGSTQGTGKDIIYYKIPVQGNSQYTITAEVCYQSIPPRLVSYLQGISTPDIQKFIALYNASDKNPVIMKTITYSYTTNIAPVNTSIPKNYLLYQNFPNPFNSSTNIKFDILRTGNSVLEIFDITGKNVITSVNEILKPGTYIIRVDGNNLPTGIYFYKLLSGDFSETKKFVIIK